MNELLDPAEPRDAVTKKSGMEGAGFPGDTFVLTPGGIEDSDGTYSRMIERLEVGDEVLSRCEVTGEVAYKCITKVFAHGFKKVCLIGCAYSAELYERRPTALQATAEQPFWVEGKGWTKVRDLQAGDEFVTYSGVKATCTGLELDAVTADVFSLEVEGFHTYFIGDSGIWVHNTNCPVDEAIEAATKKAELEGASFVEGTFVVTDEKGDRYVDKNVQAIELIEVGDKVLSRCETTGEIAYKRVTKVFERGLGKVASIRFTYSPAHYVKFGDDDVPVLATEEHPFWVGGKGWTVVRDLQPGDELLTWGGEHATVTSVRLDVYRESVYNLEVEDFHTYFVASAGLWVQAK